MGRGAERLFEALRDTMAETIIDIMHDHALDDDKNVYPLQRRVRELECREEYFSGGKKFAEDRVDELKARLALVEKVIETRKAHDDFDCPHDAEDRCFCGLTEAMLWSTAMKAEEAAGVEHHE